MALQHFTSRFLFRRVNSLVAKNQLTQGSEVSFGCEQVNSRRQCREGPGRFVDSRLRSGVSGPGPRFLVPLATPTAAAAAAAGAVVEARMEASRPGRLTASQEQLGNHCIIPVLCGESRATLTLLAFPFAVPFPRSPSLYRQDLSQSKQTEPPFNSLL
ncbi:hypothetical protein J6590_011087 [Homalodisca vitripennis]|nr:hypothetical protein J6590_011087 [Homalodisca vitripennis]